MFNVKINFITKKFKHVHFNTASKLIKKYMKQWKMLFDYFYSSLFFISLFPSRFSPDFTTTQVTRTLKFLTEQGTLFQFNLNVTLPRSMLRICQQAIPKHSDELTIAIAARIIVMFIVIGVLVAAYFEVILNAFRTRFLWSFYGSK